MLTSRMFTTRTKATVAGAGALVLAGGVLASTGVLFPHEDKGSLKELIKEHHLNTRSAPIAFVREKLEKGGEASHEILNGPSQQAYDDRAFPRTSIDPAVQDGAAQAFALAQTRGAAKGVPTGASGDAVAAATPLGSWNPLGPKTFQVPGAVTYTGRPATVSGRTTAIAVQPGCSTTSCVVYIGTAGGGVWKTTDGLATQPTWTHIGEDLPSTAIGSVTLTADGTLYVGTGEQNGSSDSEAGRGLYRSTDQGTRFSRVRTTINGTDFTRDRSVSDVVVDVRRPGHLLLGTAVARHGSSSVNGGRFTPPLAAAVGLYESTNGGASWTIALAKAGDPVDPGTATGGDYFKGGVTQVAVDPAAPNTVYAAVSAYGLFRRVGTDPWTQIYAAPFPDTQGSRTAFAAVVLPNGKTRLYLGDGTAFDGGKAGLISGLFRTDDARAAAVSFTALSSATPGTDGYDSYNFCQAQCSYDIAVTASSEAPDEVFLSGSMNYGEIFAAHKPSNGRAVIRSTDAGRSFTDMTNDKAGNGLHPDQHDLALVPGTVGTPGETFFSVSDGGVVAQHGPYVDQSAQCSTRGLTGADLNDCRRWLSAVPTTNDFVNKGLETLQFQSVSVAPAAHSVMGGTQDNGTFVNDKADRGPRSWFESVGGDGGQSGYDAAKSSTRYHSYYGAQHDVNFRGSDPAGWNWISDPLLASKEAASFYTPLVADPVKAGSVFDGLQHVWRTTDHGGSQAYLDKHCNELTGDFAKPCGDWQPLGGGALDAPGDLSGTAYGTDYAGAANYVVAIERSKSDTSTMWAGTRRGRLFLSRNADAAASSVTFQRVDKALGLPARFISGLVVDPGDPDHLFVSYSGYSAYSPGGHVYEVRWDPKTGRGKATNLTFDLGDQPVDAIARTSSGGLFVATDFGVFTLNGASWKVAGNGLPRVATFGLTYTNGVLYAATHGRSIWTLTAP